MLIARTATVLLSAVAIGGLCGCTGPRVSPDEPAGASLAGNWKLDPALSDDPQKALNKLREEATKIIRRNTAIQQARVAAGAAAPTDVPSADDPHGPQRDPLHRSQMAHVLQEAIGRGEYLQIRETPEEIVFDYGNARRSFTPGVHSVVSSENGVADQRSGWSGHDYLIVVKPQMGPEVTETYGTSADGKRLTEKLHIATYELPAVDLTRVYGPAGAPPPRQLPTD